MFLIYSFFLFQELICQFHEEVTVEYVRRLLKGEVKLRGKEQQSEAYATVMDNAESLHKLFAEMVRVRRHCTGGRLGKS